MRGSSVCGEDFQFVDEYLFEMLNRYLLFLFDKWKIGGRIHIF